jgi:hypothetical protein
LVLDFEDNKASNMSVQQAVRFLRLLEQKTRRKGRDLSSPWLASMSNA